MRGKDDTSFNYRGGGVLSLTFKYRFVVIFLPLINLVEVDTDLKLPIPPPPPPKEEEEKEVIPPPMSPNEVKPIKEHKENNRNLRETRKAHLR